MIIIDLPYTTRELFRELDIPLYYRYPGEERKLARYMREYFDYSKEQGNICQETRYIIHKILKPWEPIQTHHAKPYMLIQKITNYTEIIEERLVQYPYNSKKLILEYIEQNDLDKYVCSKDQRRKLVELILSQYYDSRRITAVIDEETKTTRAMTSTEEGILRVCNGMIWNTNPSLPVYAKIKAGRSMFKSKTGGTTLTTLWLFCKKGEDFEHTWGGYDSLNTHDRYWVM